MTLPAKRRLFIDWAAYHKAQGSRVHPLLGCAAKGGSLNFLFTFPLTRSWPADERSALSVNSRKDGGKPGPEQVSDPSRGLLPLVGVAESFLPWGTRRPTTWKLVAEGWEGSNDLCFHLTFHLLLLLLHHHFQL